MRIHLLMVSVNIVGFASLLLLGFQVFRDTNSVASGTLALVFAVGVLASIGYLVYVVSRMAGARRVRR